LNGVEKMLENLPPIEYEDMEDSDENDGRANESAAQTSIATQSKENEKEAIAPAEVPIGAPSSSM